MRNLRTLKLLISGLIFLAVWHITAQNDSIPKDSISRKKTYNIRIGVDVSKPIIQLIQKQSLSVECLVDVQLKKNWFAATEIGYATEPVNADYFTFYTKGTYVKIGFNYNTYENFIGMNNEVYVGLRYAFSTFEHQLQEYQIIDGSNYFDAYQNTSGQTFSGLQAHWAEAVIGLKVETFKNLFLSTGIQFKKIISSKKPDNFDNLYIPGFGTVYNQRNGVGFHYSISYQFKI